MEMWDKNGNRLRRRTAALMVALLLCLSLGSVGVQALGGIPDRLSLTAGSRAMLNPGLPVSAELQGESVALRRLEGGLELSAGRECGSASLILRLLGILPVKTVDVEVSSARTLIPGGSSVGIAIETRGLVVVGMSDLGSTASPARRAGLKSGDIITQVDGTEVNDPAAMSALLRGGRQARLTVNRGGAVQTLALTPAVDPRDGRPRIGAWVRSGTAGVGTLTYVDPETGDFGGLGHAIADVDTGVIMPVGEGALYENEIVQINRGEKGRPGEIVGDFFTEAHQIGVITDNGALGVFGSDYSGDLDALPYPEGLPVAARSEVRLGAAQLLCDVDGSVRAYDCEIEYMEDASAPAMRALVLHVTDPALIARTGGIVQGMSGSPIIQGGKLVGAVTHVLVNDPTRGYGIFIENMLDAAG